jgi:hypothetical protein
VGASKTRSSALWTRPTAARSNSPIRRKYKVDPHSSTAR